MQLEPTSPSPSVDRLSVSFAPEFERSGSDSENIVPSDVSKLNVFEMTDGGAPSVGLTGVRHSLAPLTGVLHVKTLIF